MAYRKAPAKRTSKGGGYSKGAGGSGYRSTARAGRAKSGNSGGMQTVRIVIEQPGASAAARPVVGATVTGKGRKSPF